MLLLDLKIIGNRLYEIRSKKFISRAEVAEKAGISDRTYADIERGTTNMRIETMLKICEALSITPNDIFLNEKDSADLNKAEFEKAFEKCTAKEQSTILKIMSAYINSL